MAAVLVPAALATLVAMVLLWPGRVHLAAAPTDGGQRAPGTVTALTATTATVRLTGGPEITADLSQGPGAPRFEVGDRVVMIHLPDAVPGGHDYTVVDHQRAGPMLWLVALTALVVVVLGRRLGLTSLAGLAVSFAAASTCAACCWPGS
jgi:hypothetical protein